MALAWLWRLFQRDATSIPRARRQLESALPELERLFFETAAACGKPRGLRWKACEWSPEMEMVREKQTGRLAALVGVTIAFEAVAGSDMEDLPAVGNLRNASAVFFYHQGAWHTTGKTVFNLGPAEVIERFAAQYERVPTAADIQ
jgi:hypothetical protein